MSVVVSDQPARRRGSLVAFLIIVLLVLVALGVWAWYSSRPRPVRVVKRDIVGYISLNGTVVVPASARADVYPPFQAPVDRVESSIGAQVSRGDVLVTLNVPVLQSTVDQARRYLEQAETAYANARRQYAPQAAATGDGLSQTDLAASLAPYQQQLDAARQYYQDAKAGARGLTLRAPITGTVLALNATPGQAVTPDGKAPVATIVNLRQIQVQAEMSPQQAAYVKPDLAVLLTFAEVPARKFEGRVARITSRVDTHMGGLVTQQRYVALIDFPNPDRLVKPGMTPAVAIKTGEARDVLAVPADAVQQDRSGQATVKVLRSGRWQQAAVQPGLSDGRYTEIRSGLQSGEVVEETPNPISAAEMKLKQR